MAKKSRRDRRTSKPVTKNGTSSVAPVAVAEQVKPGTMEPVLTQKAQVETSKKSPDFSTEYHYVISDLRRMGVLAAVLFVGLIVLSFVL